MKLTINPYGVIGFGVAAGAAITQRWSLPEFCWSTWLSGLVYAYACIATAALQIILTARADQAAYAGRLPLLSRWPEGLFLLGMTALSVGVGLVAVRLYSVAFGFYGIFLSVFAEMEPLVLFGRNGFINSDFITPVMALVERCWPMALGAVLANWQDFVGPHPWRRVLVPFQQELVRLHVMVLALPLISLIAWALWRAAYQSLTIVILMGLFYLVPRKTAPAGGSSPAPADAGVAAAR